MWIQWKLRPPRLPRNKTTRERESPGHVLEDLTAIALFEQVEGDGDSLGEGVGSVDTGSSSNSMLATSPSQNKGEAGSDAAASSMFVTPVRLGGVGKASRRLSSNQWLQHTQVGGFGWTLESRL
jgi:hypothetical protein